MEESVVGGSLLLVRTTPNSEFHAKSAISQYFAADEIDDCQVGDTHCLVAVNRQPPDGRSHAYESKRALRDACITSVVTEVVSVTFSSGILMGKEKEVESALTGIVPRLQLVFTQNTVIIKGSWSSVEKARKRIHALCLKYADSELTGFSSGVASHSSSGSPFKKGMSTHCRHPPLQQLDKRSSHYDILTDISYDVVTLMKHSRCGFMSGVEYNENTETVHFTFPTLDSLSKAMKEFEHLYHTLEVAGVGREIVKVPVGVHPDGVGVLISTLENEFDNTAITWIPKNCELDVISTKLPMVKERMKQIFKNIQSFEGKPASFDQHETQRKGQQLCLYQQRYVLHFDDGRTLTLVHGDILEELVDAIVNPANRFLNHGAGIAKQIDIASGGEVHRYSQQVLERKGGQVKTGTAVITQAGGRLNCHYVIHAVGPNAREVKSPQECKVLLKSAVHESLKLGFEKGIKSVSVPAISSGVFGMNKDDVAKTIIDALVHYQKSQTHKFLKDIRIVIKDKETYTPFLTYIKSIIV